MDPKSVSYPRLVGQMIELEPGVVWPVPFTPTDHCPEPGIFHDVETGEMIPVAGYGCMPGIDAAFEGIDLLQPIWEQVFNEDGTFRESGEDQAKVKEAA